MDDLQTNIETKLRSLAEAWQDRAWDQFDVIANDIIASMFNGDFENRVRIAVLDPELAQQPGYSDVTNVVTCGMPTKSEGQSE